SKHGTLADSSVEYRPNSRHDFIAPTPHNCNINPQGSVNEDNRFLISKISELLSLAEQSSPTFEQWTAFYHGLARSSNCIRGSKHIDHLRILEKVENRWSLEFLETNNLHRLNSETGWLRGIFRKHRKSFSYLEHIIAISSLLEQEWTFEEIIMQVKSQKTTLSGKITKAKNTIKPDSELVKSNRNLWLDLIKEQQSIKEARKVNKALYAWLYRNDKTWFINTNKNYHQRHIPKGFTVDWQKRDSEFVRSLIKINDHTCFDLTLPRKSKKWWMNQTDSVSMIEKNQDKLPLVSAFLNRYSEDVSNYQIRRLSQILIDSILNNQTLQRWEILRLAKLSDERITPESSRFLEHAYSIANKRINKVSI
ncbi:TnsD family Tn7-like transposition protein, partial [Psychrobacter celer]